MAACLDYRRLVVICVICVAALSSLASGESCKRISTCECECSGGVIDLTDLDGKDGPRYKDEPDSTSTGYTYSYNPCSPFTETNPAAIYDFCHDVASCQVVDQGTTFQFYDAGKQDSVEFNTASGDDVGYSDVGDVVIAKYKSDSADTERHTEVVLVCNDDNDETTFAVIGELPIAQPTYRYVLVSPYCCFTSVGLSAGSIMLIVFFSIVFVYIVAMVIYNKVAKKSSGKDLIPNREFWVDLPALIKDGTLFIFRRSAVSSERVPLK